MDFRDFPLFRDLSDEQVERFVEGCEEIDVPAGDVYIEQGKSGDKLYFVCDGEMEVFVTGDDGREHQLAVLTAPAVVGEMEFLTGEARAASVRTRTRVRGLALRFDRLMEQLEGGDWPTLRVFYRTAQVIVRRLVAMNRKFAELEEEMPPARVNELRSFQQSLLNEWTI